MISGIGGSKLVVPQLNGDVILRFTARFERRVSSAATRGWPTVMLDRVSTDVLNVIFF